jgi:hypothetical protein
MDKEYEDLQFAENEYFRASSLALKSAGSNKGTIARVEKLLKEVDQKGSELYMELQDGIKAVEAQNSKPEARTDPDKEAYDRIDMAIESLRKQYAIKKTEILETATINLRAIALGR